MVTWTRMRDGQWGIIGPAEVIGRNAHIEVTKKSGEKKTVGIGRIVWTGESKYGKGRVSIAEVVVERKASPVASYVASHESACCGYACPVSGRRCTSSDPCHDCI